jgi:hypothetical protein
MKNILFGLLLSLIPLSAFSYEVPAEIVEVICYGTTISNEAEDVRIVVYRQRFKEEKNIDIDRIASNTRFASFAVLRENLLQKTRPDFIANPAPVKNVGIKYVGTDKELWVRNNGKHRFLLNGKESITIKSCDKYVQILSNEESEEE